MNDGITIRGALGVCSYMMLISGLTTIDPSQSLSKRQQAEGLYESLSPKIELPVFDFGESVTLQSSTRVDEDFEILYNFISSIVSEMKPLSNDIAEFVSESFWDLI